MNARNRSLIDVPAMAKAIEVKVEPGPGPRTSDEEHARQMGKASKRTANLLGCCSECWDDLQIVDGRWVCFTCDAHEALDVVAEDYASVKT